MLAFKRNVIRGAQIATPDQQAAADSFLQLLKARGYDLSEAQADLDRWSRLAKMRPGNPGWYREKEIAALQERDANQKQNLENDEN